MDSERLSGSSHTDPIQKRRCRASDSVFAIFFGGVVILENLSPLPSGLASYPHLGCLGENYLTDDEAIKITNSNTKRLLRKKMNQPPAPDINNVFGGVHVGYQA